MTIRKSDVHIGGGIHVSAGCLYDKSKRIRALNRASLVNRSIELFRKRLDIPQDLVFCIKSIKGTTTGSYYPKSKSVVLSYKQTPQQFLQTLAHELVHAEQYKQGRLESKMVNYRWVNFWHGVPGKRGTTFNSYYNQPWEIEARKRQGALAKEVMEELKRIYNDID